MCELRFPSNGFGFGMKFLYSLSLFSWYMQVNCVVNPERFSSKRCWFRYEIPIYIYIYIYIIHRYTHIYTYGYINIPCINFMV
jgi:hypothetical protein